MAAIRTEGTDVRVSEGDDLDVLDVEDIEEAAPFEIVPVWPPARGDEEPLELEDVEEAAPFEIVPVWPPARGDEEPLELEDVEDFELPGDYQSSDGGLSVDEGPSSRPPAHGPIVALPSSGQRVGKLQSAGQDQITVRKVTGMSRQFTWVSMASTADDGTRIDELWDYDKRRNRDLVLTFEIPLWVDNLLAATGIYAFTHRIEKERLKAGENYFNTPFPTVHWLVSALPFEIAVSVAVIVNCTLIGWQASLEVGTYAELFSASEHFFAGLFTIEWCLRVIAFGWVWVFEPMNLFDSIVIFSTGALLKWVMEPLGQDISTYRVIAVLRVLRLSRIAKSLRLVPAFKEQWLLISGVMHAVRPLLWTLSIAMIILYVFAVLATELIGRRKIFEEDDHAQEFFGNVLKSVFSMFQVMTLDSWGNNVARPLMEKDSGLGVFFVGFIGIGVFIFWNLITATIVEDAHRVRMADSAHQAKVRDEQMRRDFKILADVFMELDSDGSGSLSIDEFFHALQNPKVKDIMETLNFEASDVEYIYATLDDGDGELTVREFATGIRRMKGRAKSKDVQDTVRKLRHTFLAESQMRAQVNQLGSSLESIEAELQALAWDTGEIVGLFEEVFHRLQSHIERANHAQMIEQRKKEKEQRRREEAEAEMEVYREELALAAAARADGA